LIVGELLQLIQACVLLFYCYWNLCLWCSA